MILLREEIVILLYQIAKISTYIYTSIFYKKKKKWGTGALSPKFMNSYVSKLEGNLQINNMNEDNMKEKIDTITKTLRIFVVQ